MGELKVAPSLEELADTWLGMSGISDEATHDDLPGDEPGFFDEAINGPPDVLDMPGPQYPEAELLADLIESENSQDIEETASDPSAAETTEKAAQKYEDAPAHDEQPTNAQANFVRWEVVDGVRAYMRSIGKVALLRAEQEVELAKRIEAGLLARAVLEVRNPETREAKLESTRLHMKDKKKPEAEIAKNIKRLKAMAFDEMVQTDALEEVAKDSDEAKEHLTNANLRLVVSIAKRYTDRGLPLLDLIGEGNFGLIRAVEKFDYTKGYKFSTYATWWIRQAVTRGLADNGHPIRMPVHAYEHVHKLGGVARRLQVELEREATPEELAKEMDMTPEKVLELQDRARLPINLDEKVGDKQDTSVGDLVHESEEPDIMGMLVYSERSEDIQRALAILTPREQAVMLWRYGFEDGKQHTLEQIGEKFGVTREAIRQTVNRALDKLRNPVRAEALRAYLE